VAGKNGLFRAGNDIHHVKAAPFRDVGRNLMKMNGSLERFPAKAGPGSDPGWGPIHVKKTRQLEI